MHNKMSYLSLNMLINVMLIKNHVYNTNLYVALQGEVAVMCSDFQPSTRQVLRSFNIINLYHHFRYPEHFSHNNIEF